MNLPKDLWKPTEAYVGAAEPNFALRNISLT